MVRPSTMYMCAHDHEDDNLGGPIRAAFRLTSTKPEELSSGDWEDNFTSVILVTFSVS